VLISRPRVSVVIPTFNRAKVLGRAITSALSQTESNIEVLIVDDASTDNTKELVKDFDDDRIVYFRHAQNEYAGAARNTGMQNARGDFIAFLDSDDEWLPHKLQAQLERLELSDSDTACCHSGVRIYKDGASTPVIRRSPPEGDVVKKYLMSRFVIWTPTFLFRRACLERVPCMDVSLRRGQDRDFYIRLLCHYRLAAVPEPLANVYLTTSKNLADVALQSRTELLNKHDKLLRQMGWLTRRRAHAFQWMLQAEDFLSEGRTRLGAEYALKSLRAFPFIPPKRFASMGWKMSRSLRNVVTPGKSH
jgi:glycosyltransferase involved in cell wall biosynthesis